MQATTDPGFEAKAFAIGVAGIETSELADTTSVSDKSCSFASATDQTRTGDECSSVAKTAGLTPAQRPQRRTMAR